ncbi:unnamed protein product, partial [Amoebophrya sp. A25]
MSSEEGTTLDEAMPPTRSGQQNAPRVVSEGESQIRRLDARANTFMPIVETSTVAASAASRSNPAPKSQATAPVQVSSSPKQSPTSSPKETPAKPPEVQKAAAQRRQNGSVLLDRANATEASMAATASAQEKAPSATTISPFLPG